jgi:hypothetical protein
MGRHNRGYTALEKPNKKRTITPKIKRYETRCKYPIRPPTQLSKTTTNVKTKINFECGCQE